MDAVGARFDIIHARITLFKDGRESVDATGYHCPSRVATPSNSNAPIVTLFARPLICGYADEDAEWIVEDVEVKIRFNWDLLVCHCHHLITLLSKRPADRSRDTPDQI